MSAERPRPSAGRLSAMLRLRSGWRGVAIAREYFARQCQIRFCASGFHVVKNGGNAVARRLAEPDVAGNNGREHAVLKKRADVARHLLPEIRTLVVHRHQD